MYCMRMWLTLPKPKSILEILTITVTDGTDAIEGATVTIGEDSDTTDSEGKAEFELAYGDYTANVTMTGYDDAEENIAFRSNHKNFTISLTEVSNEEEQGGN